MLVPGETNQSGKNTAQDHQPQHSGAKARSKLAACSERPAALRHRNMKIQRRLGQQILIWRIHTGGLGLAFHGSYIGREFRPRGPFALIGGQFLFGCLGWTRIHRLEGRRFGSRNRGRNLRGLRVCLELVQLAAQRFDFSFESFHFLRAVRRSGFIKFVLGSFCGCDQLDSGNFFGVLRQQRSRSRRLYTPKSGGGFAELKFYVALRGAVSALPQHLGHGFTLGFLIRQEKKLAGRHCSRQANHSSALKYQNRGGGFGEEFAFNESASHARTSDLDRDLASHSVYFWKRFRLKRDTGVITRLLDGLCGRNFRFQLDLQRIPARLGGRTVILGMAWRRFLPGIDGKLLWSGTRGSLRRQDG